MKLLQATICLLAALPAGCAETPTVSSAMPVTAEQMKVWEDAAHGSTITVYGTVFTFTNYYSVMASYLAAGGLGYDAMHQWYNGMTNTDPLVGEGPGPNTKSYYGWDTVKSKLEEMAPAEQAGTMVRNNELGMQIMNNIMWPETGSILLGYNSLNHTFIRPYLASANDGAESTNANQTCDGSTCWNMEYLRSLFRIRFATMDSFTANDLKWLMTIPLHKIAVNVTLDDSSAREFGDYMMEFIVPTAFPQGVADSSLFRFTMGIENKLLTKAKMMERVKLGIQDKYNETWTDETLTLLASAELDSLLLAGGLSVPTTLEYMLSLWFTNIDRAPALEGFNIFANPANLFNFMMETLRRYAPVAGVPRWKTVDGGATWQHEIPIVAQALQDPKYFPNPGTFTIGRPGLNFANLSHSIGWADFALEIDPATGLGDYLKPNSRACPGKKLSQALIMAFMEEFNASGPWEPAFSNIVVNTYKTTGFTLCKTANMSACQWKRFKWALLIAGIVLASCCCCCCCMGLLYHFCCRKGSRDGYYEDSMIYQPVITNPQMVAPAQFSRGNVPNYYM